MGNKYPDIPMTPSPELSYVLGCVVSDGCLSHYKNQYQFILVSTDKEYADSTVVAWKVLGRNPYVRYIKHPGSSNRWGKKPRWRVVVGCKSLYKWVENHSEQELFDLGLKYPYRFLAAVYEADGSIFYKSNSEHLRLAVVYKSNKALIDRLADFLVSRGYTPGVYKKEKGRDLPVYEIRLNRQGDIRRFLNLTNPVIKRMPRSHANTEPSPD